MAKQLKNRLIYHIHDNALKEFAAKYASGRLIDIGCGTKPYRTLLESYVSEHIGVDHADTLHAKSDIDLFGTAYEIPAGDSEFQTALCSAVLEHLEEPEAALKECYRILCPGGYALYSVPFIWHVHEAPRDFFRFTKFGLKYLFEKAGFEIIEIRPLSGFWVTFGQLLVYKIYEYHKGPLRFVPIIPFLGLIIQATSYLLDKVDRSTRWTWMNFVVARKPECR